MKILVPLFSPSTGTWGGLTRVISIIEAAKESGHTIAICASGYLEETLRGRGFEVFSTPESTFLGLPKVISQRIEKRSQKTTLPVRPGKSIGSIWLVLMISGMARGEYLRKVVEAEKKAADQFEPDIIFTDLDPGAFLLARLTGLPIVSAYQSVMKHGINTFAWKLMNMAVNHVLKKNGFAEERVEKLFFGDQTIKIIPSIPELEDEDCHQPDVHYVGQLLGDIKANAVQDFIPQSGKRYIFVYMGTGSISLDQVYDVLPRCLPEDGNLRAIVAAQSVTEVEQVGAVEFRPYVSAQGLLPYCDWTLCHGGQNTIIQSLIHGVPLIIFPGPIFERRFNAQRIQILGAGMMGEVDQFSPNWINSVLEQRESMAIQAAKLGGCIRSFGGAKTAILTMEKIVKERKPAID
jgi:UDP:flavonoid glycosyltransferase YjiC (YdhE family)